MPGSWFPFRVITGRPDDGPPWSSGITRSMLYGDRFRTALQPCTASVLLRSNEPGPQWELTPEQLSRLMHLWRLSPLSPSPLPQGPLDGYGGCAILCRSGDGWFAFQCVAMCKSPGLPPEYHTDGGRVFESTLLKTAPANLLPRYLF